MSKAKNPTIGKIPCTCCLVAADVRKTASGSLYIHCTTCGTDVRKGAAFQNYIAGKAEFFPGLAPAPVAVVVQDDTGDDDDVTVPGGNPARETVRPRETVDGDEAGSWLPGTLLS